jgi:hypothetical protein
MEGLTNDAPKHPEDLAADKQVPPAENIPQASNDCQKAPASNSIDS